ncbi:MAG: hypothetical protein QOG52_2754, partial [Frankiaceae bacterium]|nr:hypothetical protein [Frankiaceae bacterium]
MQGDTASQAATLGVAGERPSTGPLVEARKLTKVHPAR